jgi:hypothetical protein
LVYHGTSYWNGWFRGTLISGNLHEKVIESFSGRSRDRSASTVDRGYLAPSVKKQVHQDRPPQWRLGIQNDANVSMGFNGGPP